jgi:hypothetical protein
LRHALCRMRMMRRCTRRARGVKALIACRMVLRKQGP